MRNAQIDSEQMRRFAFRKCVGFGMFFGGVLSLYNSTARLSGLTENGLRWRYNMNSIRKFDFTSDYERGTIWKYFRA